jgi:cation diffusion facilitator family transporter
VQIDLTNRSSLRKFAWLSIAAAVATIGLKLVAYLLTQSVGLLSDAMESGVNLAGALMALAMLTVAARPPDEDHAYGHGKAEYFSSGVEGTLILVAALAIAVTAVQRLMSPRPLEQIGLGLIVSVGASLINLVVSLVLRRAARRYDSITLDASSRHLMTDVWTSGGVLAGVGLVALTGWLWVDPLVAIAVAGQIVWSGVGIVRRSVAGLMDTALSGEDIERVQRALDPFRADGVEFHALRTRQAGARRFVSLHVLVPGDWTVHQGHQFVSQIDHGIRGALGDASVLTHLESRDDPASWDDVGVDGFGKAVGPGSDPSSA